MHSTTALKQKNCWGCIERKYSECITSRVSLSWNPPPLKNITRTIICLFILGVNGACQPVAGPGSGESIQLAAATENFVKVSIQLVNKGDGQLLLSATFTPLISDLHLYSKDIPKNGVDGLGRPTLLELAEDSLLLAAGNLIENIPSQIPLFEPKELLIYPTGPVTLSLPIHLPQGNQWIDDQVLVTYMACNAQGCRAPVEEKAIPIQIPGNGLIEP